MGKPCNVLIGDEWNGCERVGKTGSEWRTEGRFKYLWRVSLGDRREYIYSDDISWIFQDSLNFKYLDLFPP